MFDKAFKSVVTFIAAIHLTPALFDNGFFAKLATYFVPKTFFRSIMERIALSAVSSAVLIYRGVFYVKLVSSYTVSLLFTRTTPYVLPTSNGFKVFGVQAITNTAEVVNYEPTRYGRLKSFVHISMKPVKFRASAAVAIKGITVLISSSVPQPAGLGLIDFRPKIGFSFIHRNIISQQIRLRYV